MASGLHWTPEVIDGLTETQLVAWNHAAWVNFKRDEERRRRERTCAFCHLERVVDGKCGYCNRQQPRGFPSAKQSPESTDVLDWTSASGQRYFFKGDQFESAAIKFKKACRRQGNMKPYAEYCRTFNMNVFSDM